MNHEHFRELREWSERKHELVSRYLHGFTKILGGATSGRVYYVDGFAGPGIYEDGAKGSPIRAAEYAQSLAGKHYQLRCINVEMDAACFANLEKSTGPYANCVKNWHGSFGNHIGTILSEIGALPTIFFLDPFGLKGIEWQHLSRLLQRPHTTEVLLRVNPQDLCRLAGFAHSDGRGAAGKRKVLSTLYGCTDPSQWIDIWDADGSEGLIRLYIARLLTAMHKPWGRSYVCSYPIKSVEGRSKYHLIFATRHPKGAVLMSDIVCAREKCYEEDVREYEEELAKGQAVRQLDMFAVLDPAPTEDDIFASLVNRLQEDIWRSFQGKTDSRLEIHAAMLSKWFGRISSSHLTRALKSLEEAGRIVHRSGTRSKPDTVFAFAP